MSKSKKPYSNGREPDSISSSDIPAQEATETHVYYQPAPASVPIHKIQPRQPIPPIPEGEEVSDDTPTPPAKID